MFLVAVFFIFIFFILVLSSTHLISSIVSFIICLLSYVYCYYKIDNIWPKSGSFLIFSKNKLTVNIAFSSKDKANDKKEFIAQVFSTSIHNSRFIVLRLKEAESYGYNKTWLILTRDSMNATDFTRLRRMLLALKDKD